MALECHDQLGASEHVVDHAAADVAGHGRVGGGCVDNSSPTRRHEVIGGLHRADPSQQVQLDKVACEHIHADSRERETARQAAGAEKTGVGREGDGAAYGGRRRATGQ